MECNRDALLAQLRQLLGSIPFWAEKLAGDTSSFAIHIAVFREPYLTYIFDGRKTVESRFAKRACPPFRRVAKGDIVLLKRTPGDLMGVCLVENAWFYDIDSQSLDLIRTKFGRAICPSNESFWDERAAATVATLLAIGRVAKFTPFKIQKRDRRAWIVLSQRPNQLSDVW